MILRPRSSDKMSEESQQNGRKMSTKNGEGIPQSLSLSTITEEQQDARRGSLSHMIAYVTGKTVEGGSSPNSPGGSIGNSSSHGKSTKGVGLRRSIVDDARAYITGESGKDSPTNSSTKQSTSNVLKSVSSLLFLKGATSSLLISENRRASVSSSFKSPRLSAKEDCKEVERDVYHRRQARFSPAELALHAIIMNPIGIGYFLAFCSAEHQIEYINFFLQVEEYKALTGVKSMFVSESLPSVSHRSIDSEKDGDNIPSWMAMDEKIFKTPSDNLMVASSDLVNTRSSTQAAYRRMSLNKSDRDGMNEMHPSAIKICDIFLNEVAFAMKTKIPIPPEEEEPVQQTAKKRTSAHLSLSMSTKSAIPIRNLFSKSGVGGGGGTNSAKESISAMLSPRNFTMTPRSQLNAATVYDEEISPREYDIVFSGNILTPICLSKRVASNTKLRLENSKYYGAEAFSEAAMEVFRFIAQDIYPRFLKSSWYDRMKKRGKLVTDVGRGDLSHLLPRANTLRVRPPDSKILESIAAGGGPSALDQAFADANAAASAGGGGGSHSHRRSTSQGPASQPKFFTMDDIISDGILYNEFLQRLKQTTNTEYLLCLRSINVFKDIINPPPPKPKNTRNRTLTQRVSINLVGNSVVEGKNSRGSSSSRASISEAPGDDRRSARSSFQRSSIVSVAENPDEKAMEELQELERKAQKMEDQAWLIYQFFVAKGSALEISLTQKHREEIMGQLATPTLHMFDHLEAAARIQLEFIFTNYKRQNQESYVTWESRAIIVAQNIHNIETGTKQTRWKREIYKKIALLRRIFKRKLRKIFIS